MNKEYDFKETETVGNKNSLSVMSQIILIICTTAFSVINTTDFGGILSLLLSVAFCTFFVTVTKNKIAVIIPALAAVAISAAVTGVSLKNITALLIIPCSVAIYFCEKNKTSKLFTVGIGALVIGLSWAAMIALDMKVQYGSVLSGIESVKAEFSKGFDEIFSAMNDFYNHAIKSTGAKESVAFTEEDAAMIKKSILMILPGMFAFASVVVSYCTEKIQHLLLKVNRCENEIINQNGHLLLSLPSALIFIVCYTVTELFAGDYMLYYAAENLMIILLFPAFVSSLHTVFGKNGFARRPGKKSLKILALVLLIFMVITSVFYALVWVAFFGAFLTVFNKFAQLAEKK